MNNVSELTKDVSKRIEMLLEKYRGYKYDSMVEKMAEIDASEYARDYFITKCENVTGGEYFAIFINPKERNGKIRGFNIKVFLMNPLWN